MRQAGTVEIPKPEYPYTEAIGIAPEDLPSGVRSSHRCPLKAQGKVCVKRHPNRFINFLMAPLRFPIAGDSIDIQLNIARDKEQVDWIRRFGNRTMVTSHHIAYGMVIERYGPVAMQFRLEWSEGILFYRQVGFRFCGVPFPKAIAPKTSAEVTSVEGEPDAWHVQVRVRLPLFGVVCEYGGKLCPQ